MKAKLVIALLYFFGHLPLRLNQAIGGFLGWMLWLIPTRAKTTTLTNLQLCFPEKDKHWIKDTARQSLIETGKTLTESPFLWYASAKRIRELITAVSDMPALEDAVKQGRGAILVSPHIGSWEMTGLFAGSHYAMTSLYKPPKIQELDTLVKQARETTGSRLVPTTAGGIRQLQQALANRECIGMLPDQEPKGSGGVFAPFFNIPAYTMTLLHKLAHDNQVPVIISFAERLPKGKGYYLHILVPDERIHDKDPAISAAAMNATIEKIIRINPSQYMWNYKRFKKRPDNAESFYP